MKPASLLQGLFGPSTPTVEPAALVGELDRGEAPAILDVRGADEYGGELGHIRGAHNVPLPHLAQELPRLEALKHRRVVVVCRTDRRSAAAAELLRRVGFGSVEVLSGGMMLWNRLGHPVDRHGEKPPHP